MSEIVVIDGDLSLDYQLDGEAEKVIRVTEHALPVYSGATNVVPDFSQHVLPTANTTVLQNITVEATPVNSAINAAGGYTVWIGGI